MSPVVPNDFKELIPAPGGSFCEKIFKNLLRGLPEKVYSYVSYERDENGLLSNDIKAEICGLECFNCDGGTGSNPTTGLATPVIAASDGTFSNKVRITWPAVAGATKYYLFRNLVNQTPTINTTPIAIIDSPTVLYDDTSIVIGTVYYYWVRAVSATEISALSAPDSGYAENVAAGEVRFETPGETPWVVPVGVVSIDVRVISGGGSGAGARLVSPSAHVAGAGGGGGGGGYTEVLNIVTTPGETLTVLVGAGGVHPATTNLGALNIPGVTGGDSKLKRSATILASSSGGHGGGVAVIPPAGGQGAGGDGGAGTSSVGADGQDGLQAGAVCIGGVGGVSGQPLYDKGKGGSGQTIAPVAITGEEQPPPGSQLPSTQPSNRPSNGGSGIVVIFY